MVSCNGGYLLLSRSYHYLYVIGLLMPSLTICLCFIILHSVKFYHSSILCSNFKSNSYSVFWLTDLWYVFHIISPILSSTTLRQWCPLLDLPPVRSNIPRNVIMSFLTTPITVVTRLTWKLIWCHYEILCVILFCVVESLKR